MLSINLKVLFIAVSLFGSFNLFSQGANCGAATSLTSAATCSNSAFSISNGNSGLGSSSCVSGINDDAWYSFTATGTVSTVSLSGASNNVAAVIYSGSCGGLTEIGCDDQGATSVSAAATTVIGTTYYVRLIRTNNGGGSTTGNICVTGAGGGSNLVTNDDFTGGTTSWTDCGNSTEIMNTSQWHGGNSPYTPNDFAEIDGGTDATAGNTDDMVICQNVLGLTIGDGYIVCLDVMRRPGPSSCTSSFGQPATVTTLLAIDNGALSTSFSSSSTTWTWTTICFPFTATATTQQLTLNPSDGSNCGMLVTNISIAAVLPIEMLSFTATTEDDKIVKLDWVTASEINNDYFAIERSIDAISWESIEEVDGSGNSSTLLTYKTYDSNPHSGTSYYRIKQIDFNGDYSYSAIRSVNLIKNNTNIFPNPANDKIVIESNTLNTADFRIYNILGEIVGTEFSLTRINENQIEINISSLPSGVYVIQINSEVHKVRKL